MSGTSAQGKSAFISKQKGDIFNPPFIRGVLGERVEQGVCENFEKELEDG